jgi:hypothetical protein
MKKIKCLGLSVVYYFFPLVALGGDALGEGLTKADDSGLSNTTFGNILYGAINFGAFLLGALGVLGFIISGILYITSTGNDDRMEMAKKGMMYSFIGIAVGGLGYAFVITMQKVFQGANTGF